MEYDIVAFAANAQWPPYFRTYSSLTRTYTPLLCKYSIQLASSPFVFSTIPSARLPCPLLFSLTEGEPTGEICGKHIWVTHVRALIGGYCVGGWVPACFSMHVWVAYPCRQQQQAFRLQTRFLFHIVIKLLPCCTTLHSLPPSSAPLTLCLCLLGVRRATADSGQRALGEFPASWGGAGCTAAVCALAGPLSQMRAPETMIIYVL